MSIKEFIEENMVAGVNLSFTKLKSRLEDCAPDRDTGNTGIDYGYLGTVRYCVETNLDDCGDVLKDMILSMREGMFKEFPPLGGHVSVTTQVLELPDFSKGGRFLVFIFKVKNLGYFHDLHLSDLDEYFKEQEHLINKAIRNKSKEDRYYKLPDGAVVDLKKLGTVGGVVADYPGHNSVGGRVYFEYGTNCVSIFTRVSRGNSKDIEEVEEIKNDLVKCWKIFNDVI